MCKMIAFLIGRGTQRMIGEILHENHGMRDLARSNGFVVDPAGSDADALRVVLTLPGSK